MFATLKKFIQIFGVLFIGIMLVATWFLYSRNQNHMEVIVSRQQDVVSDVAKALSQDLQSHVSDARFMAQLVSRYYEHGHKERQALEDFFADFSRSREVYFSLRYLDQNGNEVVRVDRSYTGPVITPPSALQEKIDRYYFRETAKSSKNDVYMSHFDLNMEHGRMEEPYRPTLRFGSPVVDQNGDRRGVVVLSFDGNTLLNSLRQKPHGGPGVILLANGDGYWLLGPTPEEEWGHVLEDRNDSSMGNRFPDAWGRIIAADEGQFQNRKGLFTFETADVTPGQVISGGSSGTDDVVRRWKIMTWVPEEQLSVPWLDLYLVFGGVLLVLLAMGCWHVADNRVHQEAVESKLRENEERTLAISHSSQDAIAMIDSLGRIIQWNPAAERMFGYSGSDVVGSPLHELVAPDDVYADAKKGLAMFAETGKGPIIGNVMDVIGLHKSGREIPIELAASSFQFKGEWYAVGSMRDITRRLEREKELRRSEETSRALINAPTESAMLIALNGTIEAINEVGAKRMGGTVAELIGKSAFDRIAEDFAHRGRHMVARIQETGQPIAFEDERNDERMLINMYPVKGADGAVDRLAIFVRDVTRQRSAEAALVQSERRFRDVSEAVGEIIWETDPSGHLVFITEDIEGIFGAKVDDVLGSGLSAFLPEKDVEDFDHWREGVFQRQEPFSNIEARTLDRSGRAIWLLLSGTPYYDAEGAFLGYRGAAMDITDRKATENAIKASERKLRALAESAYDAIVMLDSRGKVSFWNDAAEQLLGYAEDEVLGKELLPLVLPPEALGELEQLVHDFAASGTGPAMGTISEMVAVRKDGTRVEVERSTSSFRLAGEWYAVATIRDITERKATEAKLLELATTDSLTGLFNRRRFMELCEQEFSRSIRYDRPLAMFMMDIDHFKHVNDDYGHDAGDRVLKSLAEISILALRGADVLGRLGGEEFGVLLPETDEESAREVAERLRQSIERASISINGITLSITVSIGVSILKPDMGSMESLLKKADIALYDAKQSGRNRVVLSG